MAAMGPDDSHNEFAPAVGVQFATTHWSTVLQAGDTASSPDSQAALEKLCRTYWYPVYAHIRHQGHGTEEARDLTQGFFLELLTKGRLGKAAQSRGRFRTFLLTCVDHFVSDQQDRKAAVRRGGQLDFVSLDDPVWEARFESVMATSRTAREAFDRNWATTLLESALAHLRDEAVAAGKEPLFEALCPNLMGEGAGESHAQIAARFASSEGAIGMVALRWRRRFAELVRQEILQTVADPAEVESELHVLMTAFER